MGEFHVDLGDLTALAGLMQQQGEAAHSYWQAQRNNQADGAGDGIIPAITEQLSFLRTNVQNGTFQAHFLANAAYWELTKTTEFYRDTDAKSAAALDATYLPFAETSKPAGLFPPGVAEKTFQPVNDRRNYPGPKPGNFEEDVIGTKWPTGLEELSETLFGFADAGSPAAVAGEIAKLFLHWNPIEKVTGLVSGDWNEIYLERMVIHDTANAFDDIARNVQRGRYAIQDSWRGHAAAAAEGWLDRFAYTCEEHARYCREIAEKVTLLAESVYHQYQALKVLIEALVDAVIALATWRAGPAISKVLGGFVSAATLKAAGQVIGIANEIANAVEQIWAAFHLLASFVQGVRAQGDAVQAKWPKGYDHPGAA